MGFLIRVVRALPIFAAVAALAIAVYVFLAWLRSPAEAKRIVAKILTAVLATLTAVFAALTAYAWFESNTYVLEFADACAVLSVALFVAVRLWARGGAKSTDNR